MHRFTAVSALPLLFLVVGCTLGETGNENGARVTAPAPDLLSPDTSTSGADDAFAPEPNAREAVSAQQVTSPDISRDISIDPIDAPDPCAGDNAGTDPRCRGEGSAEISGPDTGTRTSAGQASDSAEVELQTFQPQDGRGNQIDPSRTADELARGETRSSAAQFLAQDQLPPAERRDSPSAARALSDGTLPNDGVILEIIVPPAGAVGQ